MKKGRIGVKILIVVLLILGAGILGIINSFYGNPISAAVATTKINEYVKINYPGINTQITPVSYNFKNGGYYYTLVQAKDSVDTMFYVRLHSGDKIEDDYRSVDNLTTTYKRLNTELDAKIEKIIAEQFHHETRLVGGSFIDIESQLQKDYFRRDMALDIEKPPLPIKLVVWCSAEHPNYKVLAERMLELQDIMDYNKIPVEYYSVSVEYPYVMENNSLQPIQWDEVTVLDFPAHRLNEGNLPVILEQYFMEWEKEHVKK